MSPRGNGISTTYKTRVATENPCKERWGTVIGQLKDRRELEPKVVRVQIEKKRRPLYEPATAHRVFGAGD
jgi:hypothetical protein